MKHEIPAVQDSVIPPNPGPFDPHATVPNGTPGGPGNPTAAKIDCPARPDPGAFVVHDREPKEVYAPKPDYPEIARQANMEGTVVLKVLVSREGRVEEVLMERSSPMFDDAAEKAIRQWRFTPALMGEEPVAAWVTIPVRFVMNGE
jgi:protein TonB